MAKRRPGRRAAAVDEAIREARAAERRSQEDSFLATLRRVPGVVKPLPEPEREHQFAAPDRALFG